MSTNYFQMPKPPCPTCGREWPRCFIGKSAGGWRFMFNHLPGLTTTQEWRDELKDAHIVDEYGRTVSYEDFWDRVESKKDGKSHAAQYPRDAYEDDEGNTFIESNTWS